MLITTFNRADRLRYLQRRTFEDEKDLLLFYRDRELEFRRATNALTWMTMRSLPGITNSPRFKAHGPAFFLSMMNSKELMLSWTSRGVGVFARTAESETYRRLILSAIAIERHRAKNGSYPKTLSAAKEAVGAGDDLGRFVDFMDGRPLRYRVTGGGQFLLYSCGPDCVDDGGIAFVRQDRQRWGQPLQIGIVAGKDLVWPRGASEQEVKAQQKKRKRKNARRARPNPVLISCRSIGGALLCAPDECGVVGQSEVVWVFGSSDCSLDRAI
jgi:hypothetical protein